jgi:hypothetical protein
MTQSTTVTPEWAPPAWLLATHEAWLAPLKRRGTLVEEGVSDRAIGRLVRSGTLARPRWGAYCAADRFEPLDARGRHAITGRAVLMQSMAETSLSHSSALTWYDAPEWGLDLATVHTTRHDGRAGRREAGVCQHKGEILPGDLVTVHGMSLTSPCRAALELTTIADIETSVVHVNHLLHRELTTLEALRARYEGMEDWPGTLHTGVVLRLARAEIESVLESRFFCLCYRNSLPMPVPQYVVNDEAGRLVARLDFAWPDRRKFAECDGKVKYEKLLKPGERASDVVLREKERDKLVRRLTGMEGERFTWSDVENEARTVARLRAFLFDT